MAIAISVWPQLNYSDVAKGARLASRAAAFYG
jgi:hypothetical protein